VRFGKTNASESLMTCRNVLRWRRNRSLEPRPREKVGKRPVYCPTGVRHEGDVSPNQAVVRNVRTCRCDVKGEAQVDSIHESRSTDAQHRGGVARSRVEGSVMGLDRRGDVVQLYFAGNLQREDLRG
jgi:hypothetical protein